MSVLKQFEHLKIPLEDILLATNTFSKDRLVGTGGFGEVYKGELVHLNGHTTVAVKRLDRKLGQGDSEFWKEVIMLSVYKHENIVSLLGFCDEKDEKILVYEYASKQSLDVHLNNKNITWVRRLIICIGAARGLAYLHDPADSQQRVLHRDIKSSNILLDENWNARIADLGLSKFGPANQQYTFVVSNNIAGTIGYCDPQYLMSGILTKESDIYSFGVVLFEVLCGRLCIGSNDKAESFVQSVRKHYRDNIVDSIVCGNIKDEINPKSLKVFSTLAYQCLKMDSRKRPPMNKIVTELETALRHQVPSPSTRLRLQPDVGSSVSPNQRRDIDTEPDDERNTMTEDFAELSAEERSSRAQPGSEKLKPANNRSRTSDIKSLFMRELDHLRFGLESIRNATNNFDHGNIIGRGESATVYIGEFFHSDLLTVCAVKRFDRVKADAMLWGEIMSVSTYRHENLIELQGFCDESDERVIVYEYALNKGLDTHINDTNLTWIQRLKICLGAASGLEYLHNQRKIVYSDFKSANIFLDKDWNAKITKFENTKYGPTNIKQMFIKKNLTGSVAYCDPMYIETGLLTKKSNVYSFGVVLFELLCSRFCVDLRYNDQRRSLTVWVKKCYKEQTLDTIIDVDIRQQIEQNCFDTFVTLAYQCLKRDPTKRPSMDVVVSKLATALEYQEVFEAKAQE